MPSGRQKKSMDTTVTTISGTVDATDDMYDTSAFLLATAERGNRRAMSTKVAMSFAGFDNFFMESNTHWKQINCLKKRKIDDMISSTITSPPLSTIRVSDSTTPISVLTQESDTVVIAAPKMKMKTKQRQRTCKQKLEA